MRRIAVGDIMTRNIISCGPSSTLYDCAKTMAKERINTILITKNKHLLGIITARDILWIITKKPSTDLRKIRSLRIAKTKIAVIKPSADISQAISKMRSLSFRRLPVLLRGEVIGMITLKDILSVDPSLYSETSELMEIREAERKLKDSNVEWPLEGFCDNCGAFSNLLKVGPKLLCLDCREELY